MPGQWVRSTPAEPLPKDWKTRRARVLRRDRYRCTDTTSGDVCGKRATEVDHIVPRFQGGDDEDDNLTSLCAVHHATKTSIEGNAARRARYQTRRRAERHPGLRWS